MPTAIVLQKTAFGLMPQSAQEAITALFDENYANGTPLHFQNIATIARERERIASLLELYRHRLAAILPASLQYLEVGGHDKALLEEMEQVLLYGFYVLSLQYYLDETEHRRQTLKDLADEIKDTASLIYQIRAIKGTPPKCLAVKEENHQKYLGLPTTTHIASERLEKFNVNKAGTIRQYMTNVNGLRLYWVWGGGFLSASLGLISDDYSGKQPTQTVVDYPSRVTGIMSWALYYARFALNLSLVLKHTIPGFWMGREERDIPAFLRFKAQWDKRKFSLLNDSIWATANLACFFWLFGSGMLGYWGNVLTAALLLMDVTLSFWRYREETAKHNQLLAQFESDQKELENKIAQEVDSEPKQYLQTVLMQLLSSKKQMELDWKYKKFELMNDLGYAVGLLAAFVVAAIFFFPPAAILPATALLIGVIGAALCFTVGLIYSLVAYKIESAKIQETITDLKDRQQALIQKYQSNTLTLAERKSIFLESEFLLKELAFQERVLHSQRLKAGRALLIDSSIPPVIFVSFMFMPFGAGLGVLAAGLVLAVASKIILDKKEPTREDKPTLIEPNFQRFEAQLLQNREGFFNGKSNSPVLMPTEAAFLPT